MHLCRALAVTNQQDILIIGAGLIGLSTADELSARGMRVRVIDARPGPCEGTSFSNSGMIHPSQALSWDPQTAFSRNHLDAARVTARLGERSKALILDKMKQLDLPLRPPGCLQLYPDIDAAREAQSRFSDIGIRANILMNAAETFGLAACQFPDDTSGDARVFGCTLAKSLDARGVSFVYDAGDVDIRQSDGQFYVKTIDAVFNAEHLVIAAGTRSIGCLDGLGVRLRLNAVAGAAADFDLPSNTAGLPACPIMDAHSRSALTVFSNRIRISGGWGVDDPASLIARWHEVAPELMAALGEPRSNWTGLRPVSHVGRPYISATSIPNLWINTGHGHMGWTLCAGSGELLAQMIVEGREDKRFAFSG